MLILLALNFFATGCQVFTLNIKTFKTPFVRVLLGFTSTCSCYKTASRRDYFKYILSLHKKAIKYSSMSHSYSSLFSATGKSKTRKGTQLSDGKLQKTELLKFDKKFENISSLCYILCDKSSTPSTNWSPIGYS
jgi:hypothetical protein